MKTEHPMTKSPRAVAREALALAREALPAYSSKYSRKDFTQHQLFAALALASLRRTGDRVLADAAFDSEAHHAYAREELGVRATVIPLNRRGQGRKWPKTRYRRQIVKRFRKKPRGGRHRRVYGQRWQAESAFSRHKRRLGSALGARSDAARERECRLRVLTHNLMLLAATG